MAYDNTNSGALFSNDNKLKDTHPDYKGTINVNGVEYWISAWVKTAKSGKRQGEDFLSISLTEKDDNRQQQRKTNTSSESSDFLAKNKQKIDSHKKPPDAPRTPVQDFDSFDDDIPF